MPGNPTFIVQNMGGAGGTKAANYLYNRAAQDGTAIGILLSDTPFASRMRTTGVKYVADKFHYIGGVEKPQGAFVVLKRSGVRTMEEAMKKEVVFASTGKGSQTYILPKLANGMLGTKFKIVLGYRGMSGVYKALDNKEVDGFQSGWSSLAIIRPQWQGEGRITVLAANSLSRLPDAAYAPTFASMVKDPKDREIVELLSNNDIIGRAWLAPPGIPKARLKAFRHPSKDGRGSGIGGRRQGTQVPLGLRAVEADAETRLEHHQCQQSAVRPRTGIAEQVRRVGFPIQGAAATVAPLFCPQFAEARYSGQPGRACPIRNVPARALSTRLPARRRSCGIR